MKRRAASFRRTIDWAKPFSDYTLAEACSALGELGSDIEGLEGRLRDLGELDYWCDLHGDLATFESPGAAISKAAAAMLKEDGE